MKCNVCNKRGGQTGSKASETSPHKDMCNYCWEEGGWENTHSDQDHEGLNAGTIEWGMTSFKKEADFKKWLAEEKEYAEGCWICHPELNLAQKPGKAKATGTKKQGIRRAQLNHKGHSHPGTPVARRACKELYWEHMSGVKNPNHAEAMAKWNCTLDGFGKPIEPVVSTDPGKTTGWNVAPLGPKGGTGASVKAAAAKASSERKLAEGAGLVKKGK